MGSLYSKYKNVKYLLCVIDFFTKYKWVKDKNGKTVLNAFVEIVNEAKRKPNKLWIDQRNKFYNKFMQEWLGNNYILMDPTYSKGNSVNTERFIITLEAEIYEIMISNDSKSYLSYSNKLVDQ